MAGTSTKTKVIGIRVPLALAARWSKEAGERDVTLAALVFDYAQRGDPIPPPDIDQHKLRPVRSKAARIVKAKAPVSSAGPRKPFVPPPTIIGDATATKPVTALNLPVLTEFPARPVYLRGQDPAKGKGKR